MVEGAFLGVSEKEAGQEELVRTVEGLKAWKPVLLLGQLAGSNQSCSGYVFCQCSVASGRQSRNVLDIYHNSRNRI